MCLGVGNAAGGQERGRRGAGEGQGRAGELYTFLVLNVVHIYHGGSTVQ